MSEPFARSISIDYSDDELDAISEAFTRPDLARRERAENPHDPVWRAQCQTALRGLVARRAITLGGTPGRPRIAFLEPHATLLGAFLGAEAIATIRHEQPRSLQAASLFVNGDVAVEQCARDGLAIQRMTAHGRGAAPELLRRRLPSAAKAGVAGGDVIELTARMMTLAVVAVEGGKAAPASVPRRAADIVFARRASGSVTITGRDRAGTRSGEDWSWIDAGELGFWSVEAEPSTPLVRLVPVAAGALAAEIEAAWLITLER